MAKGKQNKGLMIVLIIILLALAAALVYAFTFKPNLPMVRTTTATTEVTTAEASTTQTTTTETTTTETTTSETTTETTTQPTAFYQKGIWYYYDEKATEAYAFTFKKNGEADVAYFNTGNLMGEDAQYFKGYCRYEASDTEIKLTKLPSPIPQATLTITVDGETLKVNDTKLEKQKKVSLDYPVEHFNKG